MPVPEKETYRALMDGNTELYGDDNPFPVGRNEGHIAYVPVITTAAYSANDAVGALVELTEVVEVAAKGIIITGISLIDTDKQDVEMNLVFFNAAPTGIADNAAFAPTGADLRKVARVIHLASASYKDFAANSVCDPGNIDIGVATLASTSLWLQLQTPGTPTYASTTSLKLVIDYVRN